ncbi:hypothetical protein [Paracoccus lutimaris]|uniref:Hemolysin type calcium-binding protein n=1 Tax=Paracoccus lutimaris TaxID=1490030 RepID=A0A368Z017_9RHOB|nr:hypothetical protein [Paracoccus lutimaris]RCW85148.1 hypothetical protein DFP89_106168 [Paracoccus lutimaris]
MDPVSLVVGGMLAVVFGVAIFNSDDDDSGSDDSTPENSEGLTLDPETGTVTGTDGDDMITTEALASPEDAYGNVNAGAGNDTVVADFGGEILGGAGDDILTVETIYSGLVDGGEGDDIINVEPITGDIFGGEGNDTVNYDGVRTARDELVVIDTGAGDDVINAERYLDILTSAPEFVTGDGSDQINIEFDLSNGALSTDLTSGVLVGGTRLMATVTDFDAANDILTIDPTAHLDDDATLDGAPATITYNDYELVEDEDGTTIILNYTVASASQTLPMTLEVALTGATGIPADAIQIPAS